MTTGNVISFDDHANDLHLSEWAGFLKSEAVDLEKLALAHEDHLSEGQVNGTYIRCQFEAYHVPSAHPLFRGNLSHPRMREPIS